MKNPQLLAPEQPGESKQEFSAQSTGASALFHWPPVAAQVAILRNRQRPEALVLLTLFPPKAHPGERRAGSLYYLATVEQILASDSALVGAIAAALFANPGHSLGLVVNEPLPLPADWGDRPEHFKAWCTTRDGTHQTPEQQRAEQERHCRDWAIGALRARRPKQWGASNEHIGPCRWLFAECDQEGFDLADQLALAIEVFDAEPTFSIATGGKSLHVYFRLAEPITPERFTALQKLVIAAFEHLSPGCKVDGSLSKPAQVLRLAGGFHPRTGNLATIHTVSNTRLDPDALEARLRGVLPPPLLPPPPPRPGQLRRPQRTLLPYQRTRPNMEDVLAGLELIPAFASGQGQRTEFRNFIGGLIAAVKEAGGTEQQALDLCQQHSPGVLDVADYWNFDWTKIGPGSFWHHAGWHPAKARKGVQS